ncbi:MAG: YciI family protein [Rhodospirillum sp.]|nr:YciI family protein [Rhodospirillum sp.]MCF8487668.1 YciI family protein [Rhodospirillum sp.]MCF8500413.1 YciI family protein [Rhodospirillum sp.]
MLYVVQCQDKTNHAHVRQENRPAHLEFLRSWGDKVLLGGPLLTDDGEGMIGSLLILDVEDRIEAEAFAEGDPYGKAGLFETVVIKRYKIVVGTKAD